MLLKAKQAGEISQLTFLKEIKRRGLLSEDFNPQTEIDLLDIESGGKATTNDPIDPLMEQEEPKHKGRNAVGDVTEEVNGHRHTLEENGKMTTEADDEGTRHTHTWDEFAIRTSVDGGHSHTLLGRSAETKSAPPAIPPPVDGEENPDDEKIPTAGGGNKKPPIAPDDDDK
jgi:hypothetical protein